MGCDLCGCPTPRNHLCAECAQLDRDDERHETGPYDDDTVLVYECTSCGEHYEATDISVDCPACGAGRCRCLGEATEVAC